MICFCAAIVAIIVVGVSVAISLCVLILGLLVLRRRVFVYFFIVSKLEMIMTLMMCMLLLMMTTAMMILLIFYHERWLVVDCWELLALLLMLLCFLLFLLWNQDNHCAAQLLFKTTLGWGEVRGVEWAGSGRGGVWHAWKANESTRSDCVSFERSVKLFESSSSNSSGTPIDTSSRITCSVMQPHRLLSTEGAPGPWWSREAIYVSGSDERGRLF